MTGNFNTASGENNQILINLDPHTSPVNWASLIIESAKGRSTGVVEHHLVGAILQRRFKGIPVPNRHARVGSYTVSRLVCHISAAPSRNVLQKCATNVKAGLHPVLLVPREQENRAGVLAQDEGIDKELSIISIEAFVALNIIELATEESKDFFSVLQEIVQIYNKRLAEVETDLSLQIQVR